MPKLISRKFPNIRVHTASANVKFRAGEADVTDEVAAELLAIESLELTFGEPNEEQDESDEDDASDAGEADVTEPAKRKPGRPRKTD